PASRPLPRPPPFPTRRSSDLVREVAGVADERLIAQAKRAEVDRDLPARREHDLALPQTRPDHLDAQRVTGDVLAERAELPEQVADRKSTRLNSSHQIISYAVF